MFKLEKDIYQTIISGNDFTDDKFNNLNISQLNYMPYFEIRLLKQLDEKFDIFNDNILDQSSSEDNSETYDGVNWDKYISIDYNKLNRYI